MDGSCLYPLATELRAYTLYRTSRCAFRSIPRAPTLRQSLHTLLFFSAVTMSGLGTSSRQEKMCRRGCPQIACELYREQRASDVPERTWVNDIRERKPGFKCHYNYAFDTSRDKSTYELQMARS